MKNLIRKIKTSTVCNIFLDVAEFTGVDTMCYRVFFYFCRKHPSEEMLVSKVFYQENKERVYKVQSYLADDKSKEIYNKIISFRCKKDYRKFPKVEKDQYFVKDIIGLTDDEVFVDGGGYVGDTTIDFINRVGNKYRRVVIFEPDKVNYDMLQKNLRKYERIVSYNKGLYDVTARLPFQSNDGTASRIIKSGEQKVDFVAIDDIEECKDATFIKMDIEGAELNALIGAKNTIIRNRPKLAICLYHSDRDILDIIEFVYQLNPTYKLYIRHHSKRQTETVLYAI